MIPSSDSVLLIQATPCQLLTYGLVTTHKFGIDVPTEASYARIEPAEGRLLATTSRPSTGGDYLTLIMKISASWPMGTSTPVLTLENHRFHIDTCMPVAASTGASSFLSQSMNAGTNNSYPLISSASRYFRGTVTT